MRLGKIFSILFIAGLFSLLCAASSWSTGAPKSGSTTEKILPEAVWLAFLEKQPGVRDYVNIVISGSEPYQRFAFAQLENKLKIPITESNKDGYIPNYSTPHETTQAYFYSRLTENELKKLHMLNLLRYAEEPYRSRAWQLAKDLGFSHDIDLLLAALYKLADPANSEVASLLLSVGRDNPSDIFDDFDEAGRAALWYAKNPKLRKMAAKRLLKKQLTPWELWYIAVADVPEEMQEVASRRFFVIAENKDFHNFLVWKHGPVRFRARAAQQLLGRRPTEDDLYFIEHCGLEPHQTVARQLRELRKKQIYEFEQYVR